MAASRLSELPDGRFARDMKRALPDGRKHLLMTGVQQLLLLLAIRRHHGNPPAATTKTA